jgi:tetratricopeptide (TPR) repeat protein
MSVSWDRRVIPQWVRSIDPQVRFEDKKNKHQEDKSFPILDTKQKALFEKAVLEFDIEPTLGVAADALRFGLLGQVNPRLQPAARFILDHQSAVPEGLRLLALATNAGNTTGLNLHGQRIQDTLPNTAIHDSRRWLSRFPNDAMTWLDLGRLHAAAGNTDAAKKAVITALTLCPNSRLIIRGTSRFFLHARQPDVALAILERSKRLEIDPWLIAGHISISSILGKASRFTKKAKRLIDQNSLHPKDSSELASALATLELETGANKEAKKLFNLSLREPNENTLAQVEWASKHLNIRPDLPDEWLSNPISAEAGYYHALFESQFDIALARTLKWHSDEPFASRPMIAASFITAISGELDHAISYAKIGLKTEPENLMLLNNLAFSHGAKGDLAVAENLIKKIVAIEEKKPGAHTLANLGMLSYLRGEHDLGRNLYDLAEKIYLKDKRFEEATAVVCFQAHFARKVSAPDWLTLVNRARATVDKSSSKLAKAVFTKLMNEHTEDADEPPIESATKRKWHYDPDNNILTFEKRYPLGRA